MNDEKLIYASTEKSADMRYFAGMNIPDAAFAFTRKGQKHALISPLEFGRAQKQSEFDVLHPTTRQKDEDEIADILKEFEIANVSVPRDFPVWIYLHLKNRGINISVCEGDFFPERRLKKDFEIAEIKKANAAASAAYARVEQILNEAKKEKKELYWRGKTLTSELLKLEIEMACLSMGASASHTIAAGGDQACDPHNEGSGPIRPKELIIVDIFPMMQKSGYYGDMTRTFIKGSPTDAQTDIVKTVMKAQTNAIKEIRADIRADKIHLGVADFFEKTGYKTEHSNGAWRGFFHSTGHGIGLEVHEEPRLGLSKNTLQKDEVVTVEPGLYYPGIGACRIEDNVRVTPDACEKLSDFHYNWIIE